MKRDTLRGESTKRQVNFLFFFLLNFDFNASRSIKSCFRARLGFNRHFLFNSQFKSFKSKKHSYYWKNVTWEGVGKGPKSVSYVNWMAYKKLKTTKKRNWQRSLFWRHACYNVFDLLLLLSCFDSRKAYIYYHKKLLGVTSFVNAPSLRSNEHSYLNGP